MSYKVWTVQLTLVALFASMFWITQMGEMGTLENEFLRNKVFPNVRTVQGTVTNIKFKLRGPRKPKNNIVIIDVDSESIDAMKESWGRWPWPRKVQAAMIKGTFDLGAKYVGMDIVFSEPENRIMPELEKFLVSKDGRSDELIQFKGDYDFQQVIAEYADRLVLGWTTETNCQPLYQEQCALGIMDEGVISEIPDSRNKFAIKKFNAPPEFDPSKTPIESLLYFIPNYEMFTDVALHSGTFNSTPDPDGYVRRAPLFMLAGNRLHPTLGVAMARMIKGDDLIVEANLDNKIDSVKWTKTGQIIPVTALGAMEINFHGPRHTFKYVHVSEVLGIFEDEASRTLASAKSAKDYLKDAIVFIGVSAAGLNDMRAFPFDSHVPGVEGHASILDNLLTGDHLIPGTAGAGSIVILMIMIIGALIFAFFTQKWESVPALVLFVIVMAAMGFLDLKVLFENNYNWNTAFLYWEIAMIFVFTLAVKYVLEEKNKKWIHEAMGKYVSPELVKKMVENPDLLKLGGHKKELTIMFSDIRGFTTLSEKMDAKSLTEFLNDYLTIMAELVQKYNGTVDKYIGDAVMAFWGAPIDSDKHAADAVNSSIEQMRELYAHRPRWKKEYGIDVMIGIGLNSGTVAVGNMGSANNQNYTVIGDDVNLASRLEGLTKEYGSDILVTRETINCIERAKEKVPQYRVVDMVKVKGKKQAVELIQVLIGEMSDDVIALFNTARRLYSEQKWDEAIAKYQEVIKLHRDQKGEHDRASEKLIEHCKLMKEHPPGEGWDGSWTMTSK
jgi:adenylate cyclase